MSWFPIAILAQIILGTSAVFDKILLKRSIFNPWAYTFWLGVLGIFAIVLLPFGIAALSIGAVVLAVGAGAIFMLAMLLLFSTLHKSEASKSLLLIGGLTPVATLAAAWIAGTVSFGFADTIGFIALVIGGFVLFAAEEKAVRGRIALFAGASAVCFGISNVLMKWVFEQGTFATGFFWAKMGGVLFVSVFFFIPSIRQHITSSAASGHKNHHHVLYFLNRGYAAAGSVLVHVAIFFAHPALVEATQSAKYAVIFIASWLLLGEHFKGKALLRKLAALVFVVVGMAWFTASDYARNIPVDRERPITWGVTFSQKFSRGLGLNWQENFTAIMHELHPTSVRLIVYWDDSEKQKGKFDFSETDWLLAQLQGTHTKAILSFGMKAPRWPECHIPGWAQTLGTDERETALRDYMRAVVEHYRANTAITMWQVENEPYLAFGACPQRGDAFLEHEVALIKSLDPTRLVLTTDGGEFGTWYKAAKNGDVFGTTMYRRVYPRVLGPLFGVLEYPLAPSYFKAKNKVVHRLLGDPHKRFIVIELQGEPWGQKPIDQLSDTELETIFSPAYFSTIIDYAKQTGFDEYYLWGAEWWYWEKLRGSEQYWNIAKEVMTHTGL